VSRLSSFGASQRANERRRGAGREEGNKETKGTKEDKEKQQEGFGFHFGFGFLCVSPFGLGFSFVSVEAASASTLFALRRFRLLVCLL
jgi:hypothetical protein